MKAISPSAEAAADSNAFILDIVNRYNVPLQSARDGFTKLYASMAPAGFEGDQIEEIFLGISQAAATFGMSADKVDRMLTSGEIEIAPLAFMRGRTLSESYVIIDEAQNTTPVQMKMVLTRLGQNSRMVITGDLSQIDLPHGQPSGLADAVGLLENVAGVGIIHLSGDDVVRHPVVARILRAYEAGQTP